MSSAIPEQHYEGWEKLRQASAPYYDAIYAQLNPYLEGAEHILDIGGGDGHSHRAMPELSLGMTTVDVDGSALARLQTAIPGVEVVKANVAHMPFEDDSFDAAVSFNCISVMPPEEAEETRKVVDEIARVLKPGGTLLFMQDLAQDLATTAHGMIQHLPERQRGSYYVAPLFDHDSGNVDTLAYLSTEDLAIMASKGSGNVSAMLAIEGITSLLGGNWAERIYGDPLARATHAKLFTRLVAEMEATLGEGTVTKVGPLTPPIKNLQLSHFRHREDLDAEEVSLGTDYETEQPHEIEGRPVSSLYVDELALPRIVYRSATSTRQGTRVRGKTPLFVVRKRA